MYRGFGGSPAQRRMAAYGDFGLSMNVINQFLAPLEATSSSAQSSSSGLPDASQFPGSTGPSASITINGVTGVFVPTDASPAYQSPSGYVWTPGGNSGGVYVIQPGYYSSSVWAQVLQKQAQAIQTGGGADIIAGIPPGTVSEYGLAYLGYAGSTDEFLEEVGYTSQLGAVSANQSILDAMVFAACGGSGSAFAQMMAQLFGSGAAVSTSLQATMLKALGFGTGTFAWSSVVAYAAALHPGITQQGPSGTIVNPGAWDGQGVQDLVLDYWTSFPPGTLGPTQIAAAKAVFSSGSYQSTTQSLTSTGTTTAYTPPAASTSSTTPGTTVTTTLNTPPPTSNKKSGVTTTAAAPKSNTLLYAAGAGLLAALFLL
jgi:hypothetical protein